MPKKINAAKLAQMNPLVDLELMRKGLALTKELDKLGIPDAEYDLAPPFGRNRPKPSRKSQMHPHSVLIP